MMPGSGQGGNVLGGSGSKCCPSEHTCISTKFPNKSPLRTRAVRLGEVESGCRVSCPGVGRCSMQELLEVIYR